ncbi:MAG TPA: 50S ribosomal protein L6 [Candidatus Solibacter sp.]|jgi:large subunit ribosomal protein L6|nr:50S ribosomal protein L6 [Candidatus Solibacter sp.]
MSRIGKLPIPVPDGVDIDFKGTHMTVKGGRGQLELDVHPEMLIKVEEGLITVSRPTEQTRHRALHGLTRSLIANMVEGVSKGFTKDLELVGVGYRASKQGNDLQLNVGYSHPVKYATPEGITIEVPEPVKISVSGYDKELVGRVASQIRKVRPPEPYKGKGIMYKGEKIKRKAGKSGKAATS